MHRRTYYPHHFADYMDSDSDSDEEFEGGLDSYYTVRGQLEGNPHRPGNEWGNPYFNQPGTTEYIRKLVAYPRFKNNLNNIYPAKTDEDLRRIQWYYRLPQAFVDTFTDNWGVVAITHYNVSRMQYYHLTIIHNGRYSELELFSHMFALPGDPVNFYMFEATNYTNIREYNKIHLCKFNITWNNFELVTPREHRNRFQFINRCYDFHRSLQYMLLSFYINSEIDIHFPKNEQGTLVSWYNNDIHDYIVYYTTVYGKRLDAYLVYAERTQYAVIQHRIWSLE